MSQPFILRLESVTKRYASMAVPAVRDVSLSLRQGDLLALLGPSGCGKTTLLRLIAGFESTETGQVVLGDRIVDGKGCWQPPEQRDVGVVFQDYALFPHLNVFNNVAFGLKQQKRSRQTPHEIKTRVMEAIALVGLQGLERRYPHELSGGQQQRVALARALAPRPQIVLLDEPFSNLDVQVRVYLRQEVREILKQTGTSAVFVTHDQEEALAISDRVGVMRQGHIEQVGTPEDLYQQPASRFVAEFVTQANFLPAQRRGQVWETEVGCFNLDSTGSVAQTERSGELMIRQEDLYLEPDEQGEVTVRDRQFLGREYRYCLQTSSGQELHARLHTQTPLSKGTRVRIVVPQHRLQFFPASRSPMATHPSAALHAS